MKVFVMLSLIWTGAEQELGKIVTSTEEGLIEFVMQGFLSSKIKKRGKTSEFFCSKYTTAKEKWIFQLIQTSIKECKCMKWL